jgi:hypothetical protein
MTRGSSPRWGWRVTSRPTTSPECAHSPRHSRPLMRWLRCAPPNRWARWRGTASHPASGASTTRCGDSPTPYWSSATRISDSVVAWGQPHRPGCCPREQMALSLGFHIVLACFGVAFPTMIFLMHRRGIVGDDPTALRLARRWAKVSALLFAIGAIGLRITLAHKPTLAEVSCPSVPPGQHGNPPRSADWSSPAGVGRAGVLRHRPRFVAVHLGFHPYEGR